MLYGFVLTIHILVSFILIAVILLQAGRGGGLADTFGGGAAQSMFGTRGTVILTRATTVCAAVFMLTSLTLAVLSVQQGRSLMERAPAKQPETPKPTEQKPVDQK
ncbi:MAG: preprotein translocase subunit SecG [Candidatus Omnitrophica bacterium]|nr:preprotein translocase subunit SecG [Candidatus Omnitrophota bacterium]